MSRLLELRFSLENELMTTVRLATGGVCALLGLNLDESEDCKVCVTESLLLLKHRGYAAAQVVFEEDGKVHIAGEGEPKESEDEYPEDEISFALLSALLDGVETEKQGEKLHAIAFRIGTRA